MGGGLEGGWEGGWEGSWEGVGKGVGRVAGVGRKLGGGREGVWRGGWEFDLILGILICVYFVQYPMCLHHGMMRWTCVLHVF